MNGDRSHAARIEELRHKVCMALRATDGNASLRVMLSELLQSVFSPRLGRDGRCQFGWIKAGVAPGNVGVVDQIRNAPILEWTKQIRRDAIRHRSLKYE